MLRGLCGMRLFGHDCDCCQYCNARLADPDDMGARAEHLEECDQVLDEIVKIEPAVPPRDVASVVPVGNVDIVVG